jgi:hypothetical protein
VGRRPGCGVPHATRSPALMRLCPGRGTAGPSARSRTTITTFRSNSRASGREVTATACRSVHCTGGTAKCAPQVRPPSPRATHFSRMLAARTLARTLVRTLARTLVRTLSPHPRPHPCPHPRPQPQPHPSPAPSPAAAAAPLARTLARSRSRTPRARRLCREGSVVRARAASRRKEACPVLHVVSAVMRSEVWSVETYS